MLLLTMLNSIHNIVKCSLYGTAILQHSSTLFQQPKIVQCWQLVKFCAIYHCHIHFAVAAFFWSVEIQKMLIPGNSTESCLSLLQVHSRLVAMSLSQRMDTFSFIAPNRVPFDSPFNLALYSHSLGGWESFSKSPRLKSYVHCLERICLP